MVWVRLDDKRALHDKLTAAGFAARGLDEAALCLSASQGTDGKITKAMLAALAAAHETPMRAALALVKRLVDVRRWEAVGDHWLIHDYLVYNPSAATVHGQNERLSLVRSEAGKRGGLRSGEARRRTKPEANGNPHASSNGQEADEAQLRQQPVCFEAPSRPLPVVQNQDPVLVSTHDGVATIRDKRDQDSEKRGREPDRGADRLVAQLVAVCTGKKRDTVQDEAVQVVAWALGYVDRRVVEESIGYAARLDVAPVLPRAVAPLIERRAADYEIRIQPFRPPTKAVS